VRDADHIEPLRALALGLPARDFRPEAACKALFLTNGAHYRRPVGNIHGRVPEVARNGCGSWLAT
jgi:hypothetical protein